MALPESPTRKELPMRRILALAALALALGAGCASQQGMPEVGPPRRGVALGTTIMREWGKCSTGGHVLCSLEESPDGTWEVIGYPYDQAITIPHPDAWKGQSGHITLTPPTTAIAPPPAPIDAARTFLAGPAEDDPETLDAMSECEEGEYKVCDYHDGVVEGIR